MTYLLQRTTTPKRQVQHIIDKSHGRQTQNAGELFKPASVYVWANPIPGISSGHPRQTTH